MSSVSILSYIDIAVVKQLEVILKKVIYNEEADQNMVWAYLIGRNTVHDDDFCHGIKFFFGEPANGQTYWTHESKPKQAIPAQQNLNGARWEAGNQVEKNTAKRVVQLRGSKNKKGK